jgi:DNA-binding transcriptional LysR family regulator
MQPMLDWGDLRFFLELSRMGTLVAAAKKLKVDNTTVGRRLTALERDLGAKLFTRTPDGLALTTAGEAMRTASEEIEQAVLRGEQQVVGADKSLGGLVRIAATEMLGEVVILPAARTLPDQIRIDLVVGTARVDVARREADVALRYVRAEGADLMARRVGTVAFATYGSKSYLANKRAVNDVITYDAGIRTWRPDHPDGRVVLRTNSTRMLLQAVKEGIGIATLPCCIADGELERVSTNVEQDGIWLVVHRDVQRTARVRAVISAIEAQLTRIASVLVP